MSDDYGDHSYRKSKKEKKLKRRFRVYKKGGQHRGIEFKREDSN